MFRAVGALEVTVRWFVLVNWNEIPPPPASELPLACADSDCAVAVSPEGEADSCLDAALFPIAGAGASGVGVAAAAEADHCAAAVAVGDRLRGFFLVTSVSPGWGRYAEEPG